MMKIIDIEQSKYAEGKKKTNLDKDNHCYPIKALQNMDSKFQRCALSLKFQWISVQGGQVILTNSVG